MGSTEKPVGIVGFGDLGGKLAAWLNEAGFRVVVFDPHKSSPFEQAKSLNDLSGQVGTIHWCAPLEALDELSVLIHDQTLILHASVMSLSAAAKQRLRGKGLNTGNIDIVHLLMNKHKSAVISSDSDTINIATEHLQRIGRQPRILHTKEHDRMMAISQAPMAILHKLILEELEVLQEKELLTPSAEELLAAIQARAAKWTPVTMQAILQNPEIKPFIEDMLHLTQKKHSRT